MPVLQGCASLLPCRVTDFFSSPCCTVISIPPNINNLPILPRADFSRRTNVQAGAQLSTRRWTANNLGSNRNQSAGVVESLCSISDHAPKVASSHLIYGADSRKGRLHIRHIFLWLHRGITTCLAQHLSFAPNSYPSLFLTGLQPACTSTESPVPQLLPDCSAALCRLLGCVMVMSS